MIGCIVHLVQTMYNVFQNLLSIQPYFMLIVAILCSIVFILNFHYGQQMFDDLFGTTNQEPFNIEFDYSVCRGPHTWKNYFPAANGNFQSPINIRSEYTEILRISEPLLWSGYDDLPTKITIENTGHTVDVRACFSCIPPILSGADLVDKYSFVSACFRWSLSDDEGSEHTLNDRKFPMEMQATHVSKTSQEDMSPCVKDLGILIISYFFVITKFDNPYLDPIILNLHSISEAGSCTEISPFPISWMCYPFKSGFFSYGGSLTEPPCSEGVTWFIQPEPLAISEKQMNEFRKLRNKEGVRIMKNSRPVQNLNTRIVCYNKLESKTPSKYMNYEGTSTTCSTATTHPSPINFSATCACN